jgi:YHS domain-containing protein
LFTCRSRKAAWYALSPEEILQHVVLHTPVASWLYVRLRLKVANEIARMFESTRGGSMVTDPVCGMEIEEIDVPESLQSDYEGKVYCFCSHECKSEFDQNRHRFAHAA